MYMYICVQVSVIVCNFHRMTMNYDYVYDSNDFQSFNKSIPALSSLFGLFCLETFGETSNCNSNTQIDWNLIDNTFIRAN